VKTDEVRLRVLLVQWLRCRWAFYGLQIRRHISEDAIEDTIDVYFQNDWLIASRREGTGYINDVLHKFQNCTRMLYAIAAVNTYIPTVSSISAGDSNQRE